MAQPAADKKSALDKPTLEAYVRHLFVWGPQIKVEISNPKASPLPGLMEVTVHASDEAVAREVVDRLATELLSNPLIEAYGIELLGGTSSMTSAPRVASEAVAR